MALVRGAIVAAIWVVLPGSATGLQPTTVWRVRAGSTEVTMSARGAVTGLRDARTAREMLAPGVSSDLFALNLERDGASITVRSSEAAQVTVSTVPAGGGIVAQYRNMARLGIDATCTIRTLPGETLLLWRLSAFLPAGLTLNSAAFPILVLAPRTDGRDAWVSGATKGGLYPRPSTWATGRSVYASRPGTLAAAFGCYYDRTGGFTTQARDPRGYPLALGIGRTQGGLAVQWIQSHRSTGRWDQGCDIALGAFSGTAAQPPDWRDAADLYKRWALTQPWCRRTLARRTDLPVWLRQGPAMVRFHRGWLTNPQAIERWASDYWLPRFGRVPLITAYWGWERIETWVTPDYFPVFPSDAAFEKLVRRTREQGAHVFLWPSGYHYTLTYGKRADGSFRWDDRARFDATARPHAVVGQDGSVLIGDRSWLDGGQTATMCPGDPWTRRWLDAIAAGCAKRGAELVQADQVVGGSFPACYSTSHGHPPGPGPWMADAFHRQLRSMLAACRRRQPGAVVCFEEPNELFLQQIGIQDYRDWEVVDQGTVEPASVFNYLYHEFVPTFQSNPREGDLRQAAWCLVTGQMPHLIASRQIGRGPALVDGGFEEWNGGVPDGWDKVAGWQGQAWTGTCSRDSSERHGGRASLRLTNTDRGQVVQVSQNVPVGGGFRVGRRYRLAVWMKGSGTATGNNLMAGTFAEGLKVTWSGAIPVPAGSFDWRPGAVQFTVPPGTKMLRVMLHLTQPGTLWLDDLRLEEVRPDGSSVTAARAETPPDHAFMRRWVELYHGSGRTYLQMGRMLHPPALEGATVQVDGREWPAVLCNAYQAPDGSKALVLVNATAAPQRARVAWAGQAVQVDMKPEQVTLLTEPPGSHSKALRDTSSRGQRSPMARTRPSALRSRR